MPASGSVLKALTGSCAGVPRVHLREPDDYPSTPLVRPGSTESPAAQDPIGRYRIDGEIARGGMGAILKGRDGDLGRDLAVKVLLEQHRDKPRRTQALMNDIPEQD